MHKISYVVSALIATVMATPALAQLPSETNGSFLSGMSHPLGGADHMLAMVVVGIWAMQQSSRAIWFVPGAFVGLMTVGYVLAFAGINLPLVEPVILASTMAFGVLAAFAVRAPLSVSMGIAGFFGVFHGYAHGAELGSADALPFGIGFVMVTAALHVAGVQLGYWAGKSHPLVPRGLGAMSALFGLTLIIG